MFIHSKRAAISNLFPCDLALRTHIQDDDLIRAFLTESQARMAYPSSTRRDYRAAWPESAPAGIPFGIFAESFLEFA